METTAQRDIDLHKKVGGELGAIGHPADTVPAHEQPVLSDSLRGLVPEGVEEFIHGKGPDTYVRGTAGANWRTRLRQRILGKLRWK